MTGTGSTLTPEQQKQFHAMSRKAVLKELRYRKRIPDNPTRAQLESSQEIWARSPGLSRRYAEVGFELFAAYMAAGDPDGAEVFASTSSYAAWVADEWDRILAEEAAEGA